MVTQREFLNGAIAWKFVNLQNEQKVLTVEAILQQSNSLELFGLVSEFEIWYGKQIGHLEETRLEEMKRFKEGDNKLTKKRKLNGSNDLPQLPHVNGDGSHVHNPMGIVLPPITLVKRSGQHSHLEGRPNTTRNNEWLKIEETTIH